MAEPLQQADGRDQKIGLDCIALAYGGGGDKKSDRSQGLQEIVFGRRKQQAHQGPAHEPPLTGLSNHRPLADRIAIALPNDPTNIGIN
jgi:hypothetical protein